MLSICDVKGVGPTMAAALAEKGIMSPEMLASASVGSLLAVKGVGPVRANMLIASANKLLSEPVPVVATDEDPDSPPFKETPASKAETEKAKRKSHIKSLKKEVKKRQAKLKKQQSKLVRARLALKKLT